MKKFIELPLADNDSLYVDPECIGAVFQDTVSGHKRTIVQLLGQQGGFVVHEPVETVLNKLSIH